MRSSKSRSRSKSNRPRPLGNIVNRVFDSSGPEGKVRGTPQQIIEKYLHLARDAQLSNDRVAAEAFLQHAEHYTRMLSEAQREMAAEQEARQAQQAAQGHHQHQNQQRRDDNRDQRHERREQPRIEEEPRAVEEPAPAPAPPASAQVETAQPVLDLSPEVESNLVDTPEERAVEAQPSRRPRAPRAPKPAVEGEAPRRTNTRRPRKKPEGDGSDGGPREAAE
ncbi:DUF4167 domain-containing protein [Cereibacter sp. SYSU M97828]|nr:DUF4167 domain-containing protein [Cereibacter flavus]